jgi:PAS domain S-box-containing protein
VINNPRPQVPATDQAAFLAAIVESSDDAIVSKDLNGVVTSWNSSAERIFGYTAAEMVGQPITLLIPPDREDEEPAILQRIRRGERVDHYDTVRRRKDGVLIKVSVTISPVRNAAGVIIGASKVARDVTEQQQSALSAALFAAIVQSSHDAIVSKDLNGVVTSWNEAAEQIFGYTAAEMIGRPIVLLIPPDREDEEPAILQRIRRGERVDHYDTIRRRKDGALINVSVTISPVRNAAGVIIGASKIARDVTEQKAMEARLRSYAAELATQHQQKDEFLAMLAHELRNPLAPLRTGLHLLNASPSDEVADRTRGMMERQLTHMVRLIDDLMDLSRVNRGKIVLQRELTTVQALIESAVDTSQPIVEEFGHQLSVTLPDTPLTLEADPVRLAQVVNNLINNAAKYTPKGGRIEVSAQRDGESVVIQIRDNGIGIPEDMLSKVFETFTQIGRAIDRAQGGLGIGLSLVQRLVELHGGSVRAWSAGLDQGSTFTVTLPLASTSVERAESHPPESLGADAPSGLRLLIVDDNVDGAESLAELLELAGNECRTAHSGPEALRIAREYRPDLIFLDIGLPGLSGYDVARALRQEPALQDMTLVALTGWGSPEDRRQSQEAGFDFHLTKPVEMSEVEQLLRARFAHPAQPLSTL